MVYAGLALIAIAALAIFFSMNSASEKLPTAGDYVKLSMPATTEAGKVNIMIFMKFDCPHCYDLHADMPQIVNKYGSNLSITYVPIVWSSQPGQPGQSTKSIEAYIIADQMGKGSEMIDAMFNEAHAEIVNGKTVNGNLMVMEDVATMERVAASIGLGADFNAKLEGDDAKNAALENLKLMVRYNVQGTPTIIINGNLLVNPPSLKNMDTIISSLLS